MSLRDLNKYAFINAKLRSRIANMLDDKQIETLLNSTSLEELFHQLRGTSYQSLAELYDESGDIQRLEAWIFSRNVSIFKEVGRLMEETHVSLIAALGVKQEVENLKGVIRLWFSNKIKDQNIDYRYGYLYQEKIVNDIDWDKIINAENFEQIKESLKGTLYYKPFKEFDIERINKEGLFTLETLLDRTWFSHLRKEARKLNKRDRELVEDVLARDADLKNIINSVRTGYLYGVDSKILEQSMFEGGKITQTQEFETFLATDAQQRSISNLVAKHYPELAKELHENKDKSPKEKTLLVEHFLFADRRKEFNKMLRGYPFSFGIILAYFFLEERQDKLIRTVINGINFKLSAQEIREAAL